MKEAGENPNVSTFDSLMHATERCQDPERTRRLHAEMEPEPPPLSCGACCRLLAILALPSRRVRLGTRLLAAQVID